MRSFKTAEGGLNVRKSRAGFETRAACLDTVDAFKACLANRLFGRSKAIGDDPRVRDCSAGGGGLICNEEIARLPHVADTACQQADGVEARRERHRTGARNDAIGRLPGRDAAAMGGMRSEPAVSDPSATTALPLATAAAEPEDDPPAT